MSTLQPDSTEEPAPERPASRPALSSSTLVQRLAGPLTVVNGHAQLIRRRAKSRGYGEDIALERSVAAIELAVRQMVDALVVASTDGAGERLEDTEKHA